MGLNLTDMFCTLTGFAYKQDKSREGRSFSEDLVTSGNTHTGPEHNSCLHKHLFSESYPIPFEI